MVSVQSETSEVDFNPSEVPQTVEGKTHACFYFKEIGNGFFKSNEF